MNAQIEMVRGYYENTRLDYWILWIGGDDLAVHFGYYDKNVKNHAESLLRMNEVMADAVKISSSDAVLDLGCGYGGSCISLAKNRGCKAVGLTIVPEQAEKGNQFAKKFGVADKVSIKCADYAKIPFGDKSFDVVWALESIVHAENRMKVYEEASRVLKKDGRIVIGEYLLNGDHDNLSRENKLIMDKWLKGWAMPSLLTSSQYRKYLEEAGFSNIQITDITKNVEPSLKRLDVMSTFVLIPAKILKELNIINKVRYGNLEGSYCQNRALGLGLWNYSIITAQKI